MPPSAAATHVRLGVRLGVWLVALLALGGGALLPRLATAAPLGESDAARAAVERISIATRSDRSGYVVRVHMSGPVGAYGEPRVEDGAIRWTLYNTSVAEAVQAGNAPGPLAQYWAEPQGDHLLLRFGLAPEAGPVEVSAYRDRATDDLLMNVSTSGSAPLVRIASTEEAPAAAGEPASRSGGAPSAAGSRWTFDTVVIDAGHGGKDPGATAHGLLEKEVNLRIARKLGGYIENRLEGVDVVYTRSGDEFVTLRNRGHIANEARGDLFISIHANAARNHAAHGTETYFMGMSKSDAARKVMERENSVIQLEDNPGQYEDPSGSAMQTLAQSAYMRQSEQLAGLVQHQFEARVDRKNRGVKQARFLVLWAASMPRVLVETGFLTNRSEARFLGSERGQTLVASAIFRAVRAFKKEYEKGLDLASGE